MGGAALIASCSWGPWEELGLLGGCLLRGLVWAHRVKAGLRWGAVRALCSGRRRLRWGAALPSCCSARGKEEGVDRKETGKWRKGGNRGVGVGGGAKS